MEVRHIVKKPHPKSPVLPALGCDPPWQALSILHRPDLGFITETLCRLRGKELDETCYHSDCLLSFSETAVGNSRSTIEPMSELADARVQKRLSPDACDNYRTRKHRGKPSCRGQSPAARWSAD